MNTLIFCLYLVLCVNTMLVAIAIVVVSRKLQQLNEKRCLSPSVENFINSSYREKRQQLFYEMKEQCFFDKEYAIIVKDKEILEAQLEELKKQKTAPAVVHEESIEFKISVGDVVRKGDKYVVPITVEEKRGD